jgi:hypothetical protein
MPANLPPQYLETERKLQTAKTPQEKIAIYEELLALIPKHKGTEKLRALMKTKVSKLKEQLQKQPALSRRGPGFHIERSGAGQIIVIGPPNSGKSSLIKALTGVEVEVGDYPFTTHVPAPYMMPYENIRIQLIDTPPITPDTMETWLPEIIKVTDGVLLVADLGDSACSAALEGIFDKLRERKIELVDENSEIMPENFLFFKKTLLVANKNDAGLSAENREGLNIFFGSRFKAVPVSAQADAGLWELRKKIFLLLRVVRVYSKIPGRKADLNDPFALKKGSTVLDMALAVHKDFVQNFNFARIWNKNGLEGQRVNREHILEDEDIVELHI